MKKILFTALSALVISSAVYCQQAQKKVTITGSVTDGNGNPVYGAVILVDNEKTDITTDENGKYRIRVKPAASVITVFALGKGMADARIEGRTVIDFRLAGKAGQQTSPAAKEGDAVNIGYGSVDKKDLTSSVSKIDATNSKYASYSNIYDMIKGEVPGVQVIGNRITIHGVSSINASTDPLFIVDGIAVSNIDDIRPQMVKSIEILKGSAASIYGSRGTNGVILISLIGTEKKK